MTFQRLPQVPPMELHEDLKETFACDEISPCASSSFKGFADYINAQGIAELAPCKAESLYLLRMAKRLSIAVAK